MTGIAVVIHFDTFVCANEFDVYPFSFYATKSHGKKVIASLLQLDKGNR